MVRDHVFEKASIINLAWSKVQIFLTPHGLVVAVTVIKLHQLNNVLINTCIQMLLGRFLALISRKTSLPKTMRGCDELVKLLSTMASPSQVI